MADIKLDYVNSYYDSRGKLRHAFRRKGFPRKTIKGHAGSAEFMEAYHALLEQSGGYSAETPTSRAKAGSIDALIARYVKADAFTKHLAPATQEGRLPILNHFAEFKTPSGKRYGDNRLVTMQRQSVIAWLQGKSSNVQRNHLVVVRGLIAFGIAQKQCTVDVSAGLKPIKGNKSSGHMTWKPMQLTPYRERHPLGTMARLALELMLNLGARRTDACRLGRQHLSHNDRGQAVLVWTPSKTKRSTGKRLSIPVLPSLQMALDAMPRTGHDNIMATAFLRTYAGTPFTSAPAFGNKFAIWCKEAGLLPVSCDDGRVRTFRAHGLRKCALYTLLRNGGTLGELQALGGHSSIAELQKYVAEVEQDQQAASGMAKVAAAQSRNA